MQGKCFRDLTLHFHLVLKLKGDTRFALIKRHWGIVLHVAMNISAKITFC